MAVTASNLIWQGREGSETIQGEKSATRIYRVTTDNPADDDKTILASGLVPRPGDPLPTDTTLICRTSTPRNEDVSRLVWLTTVVYSNQTGATEMDPLTDDAIIEWSTNFMQKPVYFDRDGNAVVNSAGDPFNPVPQKDDSRITATIQKNIITAASISTILLNYRDAVNSDIFVLDGISFDPLTCKLNRISLSRVKERNSIQFRIATFAIQVKGDFWTDQFLDRGFREIDPTDSSLRKLITTAEGGLVSQPALLNGSGAKLADPGPTNAVFLPFNLQKALPFTGFIPNS